MTEPISPVEIAKELLMSSEEVLMFQRGIRNQGHSKYIAISKLLPRRFKIVRMYKLAENNNAVLALFIDPTQKGYTAMQ